MLKARIFSIMDCTSDDRAESIFTGFISSLVVLNLLAVIAETEPALPQQAHTVLRIFENISVAVFLAEYLLRLITCTSDKRYAGAVSGRLRLAFTPMMLIDLFAILPALLPLFFGGIDLRFIRMLRLFRMLRILKLGRYSQSLQALTRVFRKKKEELSVVLFVLFVALLISSSLMYYVEYDAQPDKFSSILSTMWWGVATLTTVGYGDIYPITHLGKILSSIIAVTGIGIFALPTGILAAGFWESIRQEEKEVLCPHCGKPVHDEPEKKQEQASA